MPLDAQVKICPSQLQKKRSGSPGSSIQREFYSHSKIVIDLTGIISCYLYWASIGCTVIGGYGCMYMVFMFCTMSGFLLPPGIMRWIK